MKNKNYCTQNNGNCQSCSLSSYGWDCHGKAVRRGSTTIAVSLPPGLVVHLDECRGSESRSSQVARLLMAGLGLSDAEQLEMLRGR